MNERSQQYELAKNWETGSEPQSVHDNRRSDIAINFHLVS